MLDKTNEVGKIINASINGIRKNREKFREDLKDSINRHDSEDDLPMFLRLYGRIKKEELGKQQITELLQTPNRLLDLRDRVDLFNDHIQDLHSKKSNLEKGIKEKVKMLLTL